jgi:hypothetical protein
VDDRNEPLVLPQCCGVHRGRALDALDAVVVNDVITTFDKMVTSGWPVADALDALHHGYRGLAHGTVRSRTRLRSRAPRHGGGGVSGDIMKSRVAMWAP